MCLIVEALQCVERTSEILMTQTIRPVTWLRYAGLIAWLLAVVALLMMPLFASVMEEVPSGLEIAGAWVAGIAFIGVYWQAVTRLIRRDSVWIRILILTVLTFCAMAISLLSKSGVGIILMFAIAALVPWMLRFWVGVLWVAIATTILYGYTFTLISEFNLAAGLFNYGVYFGLMLVLLIASYVTRELFHAQREVRRVNSELRATQALLQENTRIAERVRIARELHDLIGHHLTALSLNLEVASHLASDKAKSHVEQGRSIAKLLLSDVREVVSDMRRDDQVDLARALRELVAGIPEPEIHLDIPEKLPFTDPSRAQILLRCAQEVITNAARHARARNLWITLRPDGEGFELIARDDGQGADTVAFGNGLTGMRERLRELGGRLNISTRPGKGFSLEAWMPREEAT